MPVGFWTMQIENPIKMNVKYNRSFLRWQVSKEADEQKN
jgi:hypothetical protein